MLMYASHSFYPEHGGKRRRKQPTLEQLESLPITTGLSMHQPDLVSSTHAGAGGGVDLDSSIGRLVIVPPPPEDEDECRMHNGSGGEKNGGEHKAMSSANSDDGEDAPEMPQASSTSGMTLPEFVDHVRAKRRIGLYEEYSEIKNRPPTGTFNHARSFENQAKNR